MPGFGSMLMGTRARLSCRYLRFHISAYASNGWLTVADLRFLKDGIAYPTVNMTGPSEPSPLVALASSEYDSNYTRWKVFDDDATGAVTWQPAAQTAPQWVGIDLGAGNAIACDGVRIAVNLMHASYVRPNDWRIDGSNDAAVWTTLYSVTGDAANWVHTVPRIFNF